MRSVLSTIIVVSVMACLAAPTAVANDKKKALELVEAAKAAHAKGDHELSLKKLREAFGFLPHPGIQVSIARRLIDLDRPEDALTELNKITARKFQKMVSAEVTKVQDLLAQPVPLIIETTPPGADVEIDGQPRMKSPARVSLPRGTVSVTVSLPGHKPITKTIVLKGTKGVRGTFALTAVEAKLRVLLTSPNDRPMPPNAWVEIDGKRTEAGLAVAIAPGRHEIRCGYKAAAVPTTLRVKVPSGKAATIRCGLPDPAETPSDWRTPVGWTSIASGAAAIAAGVGLFVSHAMDQENFPEPTYTLGDSSKQLGGGIATGLGAGLVGLGTYFLLSR